MSAKCIECKNAEFQLTPKGRTKFVAGKCIAEIKYPVTGCVTLRASRVAIWPDTEYEICDVFQLDTTESGK